MFSKKEESFFILEPIILFFILLLLGFFLISEYLISLSFLAFVPAFFTIENSYTLISYSILHANWSHLLLNLGVLLSFGSVFASRVGALYFIIFWIVSAVFCAFVHYFLFSFSSISLVGASGVLSAIMGTSVRYNFWSLLERGDQDNDMLSVKQVLKKRFLFSFILIWLVLNVLFAFLSFIFNFIIAWDVHLSGFILGFFIVPWFMPIRR